MSYSYIYIVLHVYVYMYDKYYIIYIPFRDLNNREPEKGSSEVDLKVLPIFFGPIWQSLF